MTETSARIIVCPLASIAETAVRNGAREMVSLIAEKQDFHRPGVIRADRHLKLAMNDIGFAGTGGLIAPSEAHVADLIDFVREWDQSAPLIVHCWMGVSRSPAAAAISILALQPDEDDFALAKRLRKVAPHATPNTRLIEIGDRMLGRGGRLVEAMKTIGRGAETDGRASFSIEVKDFTSPQS
ncbi:tyrosine phosphatase family protein [Aliirhizobium terrae]|uniref:tyrosine phosphatase family protein n=1 Tax=Terrirhizobium terrae TaxID=2926709 RepID=UPI0025755E43|nr:tyrosine phosphatase family protein [Rhizobium sp. CC-CFT758]WJH39494.1 tyrosine phosphatase family protein [Rhizobium sp. CC-CFT758]